MATIIITALIFFIFIQLIPSFIFHRYKELPIQFLFIAYACIALLQKDSAAIPPSFIQNLASILCISFSAAMVIIYFNILLCDKNYSRYKNILLVLNALILTAGILIFCITGKNRFFYGCFSLFTTLFLIYIPFRFFKKLKEEEVEKRILILSTYFMVIMFLGISVFYSFNFSNVQYFFIGVIIYFFGYEFFLCKTAIRFLNSYNRKQADTNYDSDDDLQTYDFSRSELLILKGFIDNPNVLRKQLENKIGLSEKTISNYLTSIYRQLNVKNISELKKILKNDKKLQALISENFKDND
ncbi:MAG: hypothetical protein UHW86_06765 [Spirochaetota bacterium]|nr:hypothetical protein [Spirochaetota bacterium]